MPTPSLNLAFLSASPLLLSRRATTSLSRRPCPPARSRPLPLLIAPTCAKESGTSPLIRTVATVMVVGLIATSFLPLAGGLKSAFKDTGSALVDAKLHRVPVFTVADATGRPFLTESEDGLSRRGYFFEDPGDAAAYLERVAASADPDAANAKILPVSLDEALKYTGRRARNMGKSIPEVFKLYPSGDEVRVAREVTGGNFGEIFGEDAVPVYYADGLAFASGASGGDAGISGGSVGSVYPLFFEKAKLDETLQSLREKDPVAAKGVGDTQVLSLQQTVREMKSGTNERLQRVMFFPSEKALQVLRDQAAADSQSDATANK